MTVRELRFKAVIPAQSSGKQHDTQRWGGLLLVAALAALVWNRPVVAVSPISLDYGSEQVGMGSKLQPVSLINHSSRQIRPAIHVMGESLSDFDFDHQACESIGPGEVCRLFVEFRPHTQGEKHAQLLVKLDSGENATAELQGTGLPALVQVMPAGLDFGTVAAGQRSVAQQITIQSEGWFRVRNVLVQGSGKAAYAVDSRECIQNKEEQKECKVSVSFAPQSAGTFPANLMIGDDGLGSPHSVWLRGSGALSLPTPAPASPPAAQVIPAVPVKEGDIRIAPMLLDFSSKPELAQQVRITNYGSGPFNVSAVSVQGENRDRFSIVQNACSELPAGGGCLVTVKYQPKVFGSNRSYNAEVRIEHNAANISSPQSIALKWESIKTPSAHITVNPPSLSFSAPLVRTASTQTATQAVTIRNDGPVEVNNLILMLRPENTSEGRYFQLSSGCSNLRPQQQCEATISFRAGEAGIYKAKLYVADPRSLVLATVNIDATVAAVAPAKPVTPGVVPNSAAKVPNSPVRQETSSPVR
jgi:hypothetical protein